MAYGHWSLCSTSTKNVQNAMIQVKELNIFPGHLNSDSDKSMNEMKSETERSAIFYIKKN